MVGPVGPAGARRFTGKPGAYEKSLEVFEIFHMGCPVGKSGLVLRPRPVESHYHYTTLRLACQ